MNILVTGSNGFIGKNLISELKNRGYQTIFEFTRETDKEKFEEYCKRADFIFHLAGVNRPNNKKEFFVGNVDLVKNLFAMLRKHRNACPIILSSSIQAELDNPYGRSKLEAEQLFFDYAKETGAKVFVYRLPNVFGKWSRPNYNSVIATFCYNIARKLPIIVHDRGKKINFVYIDDLVQELIRLMQSHINQEGGFVKVPTEYIISLGELADMILSFSKSRENNILPNISEGLQKKLFSTFLSFLPDDSFAYKLKMNIDYRGSFTEFLKTEQGQFSVNISKPGVIKGNHWHHTKVEKFLVVSGEAIIRFRRIDDDDVIEYRVSGDELEVVDIPAGYTHNIENTGTEDLITLIWANENYDPQHPDTFYTEI